MNSHFSKYFDRQKILFFLIIIIGILSTFIVDYIIKPGYFTKSLVKIFFLFILPFFYLLFNHKNKLKQILIPKKNSLLKPIFLGLIIYLIVFGAFFVAKNYYDFSIIALNAEKNYGITSTNIILIMLYITFGNSLLEEFFFRGFSFIYGKKSFGNKFAYIFSSLAFAVYHIPMMNGWFKFGLIEILIFCLALFGLIVGGLIFDYLDEKNENIYNSWIVHIFADLAILTIAFIIFGII